MESVADLSTGSSQSERHTIEILYFYLPNRPKVGIDGMMAFEDSIEASFSVDLLEHQQY